MADDGGDKTEEPTPKKLADARNKGQVPQSRELANFIVFGGLSIVLYLMAGSMYETTRELFREVLQLEVALIDNEKQFWLYLEQKIYVIFDIIGPLFAGVTFFAVAAYACQVGFMFTTEKLKPKFDKFNPIKGIKKMFSPETGMEFIKSFLKVMVIGFIFYVLFKEEMKLLIEIGMEDMEDIFIYMMKMKAEAILAVLVFLAFLGVVDLAFQKWNFKRQMKMTKQEVKDEFKQREGDPTVRSRIRQAQREASRSRMMQDIPEADVVVANPVHVAVAIKYKRGLMAAPMVIAKGAGETAVRIKEAAALYGVPILEKKQLARYLYRNCEIGEFVPESLYTAIAEVLAYVYKMKKKYRTIGGWLGDYKPSAKAARA